jgi:integrase
MPEGLLVHDLRDTAASLAISAGASIKAVQRMLGHASAKMTLDTYGSLFDEDLEDLADRLDDRFREADVTHTRPSDDKVVYFPR